MWIGTHARLHVYTCVLLRIRAHPSAITPLRLHLAQYAPTRADVDVHKRHHFGCVAHRFTFTFLAVSVSVVCFVGWAPARSLLAPAPSMATADLEAFKNMDIERGNLEVEMKDLFEYLSQDGMPGVDGPLLDAAGFPRADLDLYAIRQARLGTVLGGVSTSERRSRGHESFCKRELPLPNMPCLETRVEL